MFGMFTINILRGAVDKIYKSYRGLVGGGGEKIDMREDHC